MCKTCCTRTDNQTGTTPASPVSEPAAFEEDVAATNCLDLTGFCTSEEIKQKKKQKKQHEWVYAKNTTAIQAGVGGRAGGWSGNCALITDCLLLKSEHGVWVEVICGVNFRARSLPCLAAFTTSAPLTRWSCSDAGGAVPEDIPSPLSARSSPTHERPPINESITWLYAGRGHQQTALRTLWCCCQYISQETRLRSISERGMGEEDEGRIGS